MKSKYLKSLGLKKRMFVFLSLGLFFTKWISKKPKFDCIFFSSEKLCLRQGTWTPFFTTMIYVVFCSAKNTAVCLWKKKDLFFFSSEKVCFGQMLWMPFFYHNDLPCFLFCKKHCSLFVKKKRTFFFLIWKSLKRRMLWTPFAPLWFTLFFVTLQKTLQFVCETKKRTYGCFGPLFSPLWFKRCFLFCKKHCSLFVKKKKRTFFFSHLKKFVLDGCFGPLFHHYDLRCFLFCKNTAVWLWKKKDG